MYVWGPNVRLGYRPQTHISSRRIHLRTRASKVAAVALGRRRFGELQATLGDSGDLTRGGRGSRTCVGRSRGGPVAWWAGRVVGRSRGGSAWWTGMVGGGSVGRLRVGAGVAREAQTR